MFNSRLKYKQLSLLTDEELYNLVADRIKVSEVAFSVLYDRYSSQIWAYCLRFLGDEAVAKDVFQETFIRFYNSIDRSRAMENLGGYILKIARNLCLNHSNSVSKINAVPFDEEIYSDNTKTDNAELLDLIKNAVHKLPETYRDVFIMREYQELSYQEIADLTGETLTNVKVRIHRAKDKVRELLAEYIKEFQQQDLKI